MINIKNNLHNIVKQIEAACAAAHRAHASVKLLAVSKQQSVEKIRAAFAAGQQCFGENYAQEALQKIQKLQDLPLEWHFIGHIQSNKTRIIAENFSWIHTIQQKNIAMRLNHQRPENLAPLQVCIQVNLAHEPQKAGIDPKELLPLAHYIQQLPHLNLRGLMTLPPANLINYAEQYAHFLQLVDLKILLQQEGFTIDTLSMGMSHDFAAAIAAGATIVRIGSAIFGERIS